MAIHHTAKIPRLVKLSFYNYIRQQLVSGGMTTGTNAVELMDAFPPWTDDTTITSPGLVISHTGWNPSGYELGGGDYLDYGCIISVLAQNKNQREEP